MPTLGELQSYMKASHVAEYDRTLDSYRYILSRRDSLGDRVRFGLIALNGASLLGLMTSLGGSGQAAQWIGINSTNARYLAASFITGIIATGWSALRQEQVSTKEASDAFVRLIALQRTLGLYTMEANERTADQLTDAIKAVHDAPLIDFHYSKAAILSQAIGIGAWVFGVVSPLSAKLPPMSHWWPF